MSEEKASYRELMTNSQGIPGDQWDEQQALIEEWVNDLSERLKVDKESTGKALLDWLYINTKTDWMQMAADEDSCDNQGWPRPAGGYPEYLQDFLTRASRAWHEAWEEGPGAGMDMRISTEDFIESLHDLLDRFEESR